MIWIIKTHIYLYLGIFVILETFGLSTRIWIKPLIILNINIYHMIPYLLIFWFGLQRGEANKYHGLANLVPIWLQVLLVQIVPDALLGGPRALWEQHTEMTDKILSGEQREFLWNIKHFSTVFKYLSISCVTHWVWYYDRIKSTNLNIILRPVCHSSATNWQGIYVLWPWFWNLNLDWQKEQEESPSTSPEQKRGLQKAVKAHVVSGEVHGVHICGGSNIMT